jgi:hypothetical protein
MKLIKGFVVVVVVVVVEVGQGSQIYAFIPKCE